MASESSRSKKRKPAAPARARTARATFEAIVLNGHKGAAVEVPFDPAERWASTAVSLRPGRRGQSVLGTLNGVAFQSAIVARSKRHGLLVPSDLLDAARSAVEETVRVVIWADSAGA